jgi:hypothetical protein
MNISSLKISKNQLEKEQTETSNQLLGILGLKPDSYNRENKPIRAKSVELRENTLVFKYSEEEFAFIELLLEDEGEIVGIVDLFSIAFIYVDSAHIRDRATNNERPVVTSDWLKNTNDTDGISIHSLIAELLF